MYLQAEVSELLTSDKIVLGVLIRGTDYITTKPKGHPIQPDIDSILTKVDEFMNSSKYTHIYLATDELKYEELTREKYGKKFKSTNAITTIQFIIIII